MKVCAPVHQNDMCMLLSMIHLKMLMSPRHRRLMHIKQALRQMEHLSVDHLQDYNITETPHSDFHSTPCRHSDIGICSRPTLPTEILRSDISHVNRVHRKAKEPELRLLKIA